MATSQLPEVPFGIAPEGGEGAPRKQRMRLRLSGFAAFVERFLCNAGFDRAPWLVVAMGCGIVSWFALGSPWQWAAAIGAALLSALGGAALLRADEFPNIRGAVIGLGLIFALGVSLIWVRSEMVGAEAIEYPIVERVEGHVLSREDQPARDRVRIVMAVRDASSGEARKIRVNVPR